jgi:hypothetical protein
MDPLKAEIAFEDMDDLQVQAAELPGVIPAKVTGEIGDVAIRCQPLPVPAG